MSAIEYLIETFICANSALSKVERAETSKVLD